MKKLLSTITILLFSIMIHAQTTNDSLPSKNTVNLLSSHAPYNPLSPPNTYRNIDNPNYWKNKMPNKSYWQQDVYYNIKANIDEETDIINATQTLTYWNNSPDNLDFVFFHLYQNAFQPGSYYDELQKENGKNPRYGKYESQKLGTVINKISINQKEVKTELDNTILKVYLPRSLEPNDSITFNIDFKTYFDNGSVRRRMKLYNAWGYKHFNGVHWYPRICVYDAKFGWTKDQHLGKEFYGNFGTFDVELTFASNFIVEATGFLTNREEVLPEDLRKRLDVRNFKNKPWNEFPSTIIEYKKGETKTWKYHAENVHDFAFTADPTYRIGESWWEDKVCYSLVQEPHASKWQNAADFGANCLRVFSEDFGRYVYHKVIVADARDGMEYPMITLDGGSDPGYRGLLAHEIGHMWFFGQVGNNETYRALLDEGFTQFLTAWALIEIDGEYLVEDPPNTKYKQRFHTPRSAIDSRVYYSYIRDATKSNDPVISTHSHGFNGALSHGGGYRHVYYKTAAMLYNLQYVLGDDLFLEAMKYYFETWKIAHPYNEDFRNAIIQYTKVDLNWFFDQWLDSDKRIDYSVSAKKIEEDKYEISFERKERMQMPIDFTVIAKNGKEYKYHIPNHWFIKETDAKILPKWHGWDLIHPTYSAIIEVPSGIENVIIDPTQRLADMYMPDNSLKKNRKIKFNDNLYKYPDWKNYEIKYQPNIWYNNIDGVKFGVNIKGGYLNHHHLFDATFWVNSGISRVESYNQENPTDNISYRFNYNTNLDKLSLKTRINAHSEYIAGLHKNHLSLTKSDKKNNNKITLKFLSLYRPTSSNVDYLIYPRDWDINKFNNRIDVNIEHDYKYNNGKGEINLSLKTSTIGSDYNYSSVSLTAKNTNYFNKLTIRTRTFFQIGTGNNWAPESRLALSGANNEEMMDNKFTRSTGIFTPEDLQFSNTEMGNFHFGGEGLNIRGYSGYLAPEYDEDGKLKANTNYGNSGASISSEIDISKYLPSIITNNSINSYLFADAGFINTENVTIENYQTAFSDIRADAGIGFTYTQKRWGSLQTIQPLVLRIDLPLFLNRPMETEDFFQMRWVFGIGKSF